MNNDKGLKGHEMSVPHLEACQKWTCFCEAAKSASILAKINIVSRRDILENRHFLKTVSQVILTCSFQAFNTKSHIVAQCYYGAAVMSGRKRGLQSLMRAEVCPKAIYVHCYAHRLNLVVLSSIFSIPKAVAFFDQLATLHKFFSATVPHDRFVQTQHRLRENVQEADALRMKELKSLSKTR